MPTVAMLKDETRRTMALIPGLARVPRARVDPICVRISKNAITIPTAIIRQPITTVMYAMALMDALPIRHHHESRAVGSPSDGCRDRGKTIAHVNPHRQ